MLDAGHLLKPCETQIFTTPATVTNLQWITWPVPRGFSMAHMICVGGGGGGGGGFSAASGNRGGGGGGGGSAQTTLTIPLVHLPKVLYIQVGSGGQGSVSGGTAGAGILSYVSVYPGTDSRNIILASGAAGAGAGGTGTAAAGAAGAAGTIATVGSQMNLCTYGALHAIVGQAGIIGGAPDVGGGNISIPSNGSFIMGGGSGAGVTATDRTGGGVGTVALTLFGEYKPGSPAAGSNAGSSGPQLWEPFFSFGGTGGSSSNASVGGAGGNGAYGAGGAGGGGGTTGGRGGTGGNGIVIFVLW